MPLRRALREAQKLGIAGIELDAAGELAPKQLSQTGRRELLHLLRSHDLELTALGAPLRHGLDVPENQEGRIDHLRQVMDLSFELGPRMVLVQAGPLTEDVKDPRHGFLTQALSALARHGDRVGAILALETGLDDGPHVERFLARFDTGSLAVNLNPAHLHMAGHNPYEAVRVLGRRIVHAHANDARGSSQGGRGFAQEVSLGHGDLDWFQLLGNFEEIGYHGWLNVAGTTTGGNSPAEMAAGVEFLRGWLVKSLMNSVIVGLSRNLPVHKRHTRNSGKLRSIMRNQNQAMNESNGGNQQVVGANRSSQPCQVCSNLAVFFGGLIIERQGYIMLTQSGNQGQVCRPMRRSAMFRPINKLSQHDGAKNNV